MNLRNLIRWKAGLVSFCLSTTCYLLLVFPKHILSTVAQSTLPTPTTSLPGTSRQIINPHPFEYHLNNKQLCSLENADLLIWVHSAPSHFHQRLFIRQSWGNPKNFKKYKVALVFFLGMATDNVTQTKIEYEHETYHDIVQETFQDHYRNLTYKAISGCKWTSEFCKSADLILKVDDDMVVDIYLLFRHLHEYRNHGLVLNNTIFCNLWRERYPAREETKWKVTKEEYADSVYPPYCPGIGVIMTSDIIPKLYTESLYTPYFWIDDVYFTGILAKRINVTFQSFAGLIHMGNSHYIRTDMKFKTVYGWLFYHEHLLPAARQTWSLVVARERHRVKNGSNFV